MPHQRHVIIALLSALGAMAVCGCSTAAAAGGGGQDMSSESSALAAQLQQHIGDAPCRSDDQCRTVAWGQKACGGPERWVAWSTRTTDAQTVNELARRLSSARKADHMRSGAVSACFIQADPGARCVAGHCELMGAPPTGPAVSR